MEIKKIAVIGAGTMGNGIAHVFAQSNFHVQFIDIKDEFIERGLTTISKNLDRQIKKEIITEDEKAKILGRITKVIGIENIDPQTDFVIEAIVENKEAKLSVFNQLEKIIDKDSI